MENMLFLEIVYFMFWNRGFDIDRYSCIQTSTWLFEDGFIIIYFKWKSFILCEVDES